MEYETNENLPSIAVLEELLSDAIKAERKAWLDDGVNANKAASQKEINGVNIYDNLFYQNVKSVTSRLFTNKPSVYISTKDSFVNNDEWTQKQKITNIMQSAISNLIDSDLSNYRNAKQGQMRDLAVSQMGAMMASMVTETYTNGTERSVIRWSHIPFNRFFMTPAPRIEDVSRVWVVNVMRSKDIIEYYELEKDEKNSELFTNVDECSKNYKEQNNYNVVECYNKDDGIIYSFITNFSFNDLDITNKTIKAKEASMFLTATTFPDWYGTLKSNIKGLPFSIAHLALESNTTYPIVEYKYIERLFADYNDALARRAALQSCLDGLGTAVIESSADQSVLKALNSASVGDIVGIPFNANSQAGSPENPVNRVDYSSVINQMSALSDIESRLADKISAYSGISNYPENSPLTQANATNAQIYAIQALADERFHDYFSSYQHSTKMEYGMVFELIKQMKPSDVLTQFDNEAISIFVEAQEKLFDGIDIEVTTQDTSAADEADVAQTNQQAIASFIQVTADPAFATYPDSLKDAMLRAVIKGTPWEKTMTPIISEWISSPQAQQTKQAQAQQAEQQAKLQNDNIQAQTNALEKQGESMIINSETKRVEAKTKFIQNAGKVAADKQNVNANTAKTLVETEAKVREIHTPVTGLNPIPVAPLKVVKPKVAGGVRNAPNHPQLPFDGK